MANTNNKISWYVLQVMSGREKRVFAALDSDCAADNENVIAKDPESTRKYRSQFKGMLYGIYELNIPYEQIEEHKQGKTGKQKVVHEKLLYPGYVLVRMQLFDENGKLIPDNWNFIRGTANVIGFLGTGEFPTPLTDEEAAKMTHDDEEADAAVTKLMEVAEGPGTALAMLFEEEVVPPLPSAVAEGPEP